MIRLGIIIIVFFTMIWPAMVEAKRVALVIGNSAYVNTSSLPNPVNDANIVADAARVAGFDDVTVALDLTISNFQLALRTFRQKANGADVAMIYYAGHGMEGQGKNWLIPIDAELNTAFDLPYESINIERMMESVSGARIRMVVLDACRNNPFGNSWASGTRAVKRGLAGFDADGVLVIYAAAPGRTAVDGDGFNSPFAKSLAQRLPQPDLPLQLLGGAVRDDVLAATGGTQRPFVSASITGTPVYLVRPKPRTATPESRAVAGATVRSPSASLSTANRATMDALMWRGANAAATLTAYQAYVKEFPEGLFADLAAQNIARLRGSTTNAAKPSDSAISSSVQSLVPGSGSSTGFTGASMAAIPDASSANSSAVKPVPAGVSSSGKDAPMLSGPSNDANQPSQVDLAYVPPQATGPDLPALPPTPVLAKDGYPDCREKHQVYEMPFDRAEAINQCTVQLDKYYSETLTPFREKMIAHQEIISQLYVDKVGGNMQYSPKRQDGFYKMMMEEHADSDPDGINLADYRAAEARYQKDREYLQDRFCFYTGCGGYPVPEFDARKAQAQPKIRIERSADATQGPIAVASAADATRVSKKKTRKKRQRSRNKNCQGAKKGGGLIGGLLGGVLGNAAGFGKVGTVLASGLGAVLGSVIACRLDEKEQEKAAEATMIIVEKEEVGAVAKWQSPTRADVSGSSTITALTAEPDGRKCLSITDIAIIDGEEVKVAKQMCRGAGEKSYSLMA